MPLNQIISLDRFIDICTTIVEEEGKHAFGNFSPKLSGDKLFLLSISSRLLRTRLGDVDLTLSDNSLRNIFKNAHFLHTHTPISLPPLSLFLDLDSFNNFFPE